MSRTNVWLFISIVCCSRDGERRCVRAKCAAGSGGLGPGGEAPAAAGWRRRRPMAGRAAPPANEAARLTGRASAMLPETCTNALFADSPPREKAPRGFKLLYVDKTLL